MNVSRAWARRREDYLRQLVLEEVLPEDCRSACRLGLLEVHNLHRYFEPEVICPDFPVISVLASRLTGPLRWSDEMLRCFDSAPTVCLANFDIDFAQAFVGFTRNEYTMLMRAILDHLSLARPLGSLHVNIGATVDRSAAACAETLLELLDEGATRTSPFVIHRVREGVNLRTGDPGFYLTQRALQLSRLRQGIAFSLLDSELNREWLESTAYTGDGVRLEPLHGDLFRGARGVTVNGIVTVNVPQAAEEDWPALQRTLYLAGRILAQKLELMVSGGTAGATSGANLINLAGLRFGAANSLGGFAVLEKIVGRVAQIERDLGLSLAIATMEPLETMTGQGHAETGLVLEAQRQHQLRGGHSLVLPSGAHMSWEELHAVLCSAHRAGVSFIRFSPDDIRCNVCHLPVAAPGACPECGSEARRTVDFVEGRLRSMVTGGAIF